MVVVAHTRRMKSRSSKEISNEYYSRDSSSDPALSILAPTSPSEAGQITVTARLRPADKVIKSSLTLSADSHESKILVSRSNEEPLMLQFDHAFGPEASQAHLYRKSFNHLSECIFKG
jgi:hypothetical protein